MRIASLALTGFLLVAFLPGLASADGHMEPLCTVYVNGDCQVEVPGVYVVHCHGGGWAIHVEGGSHMACIDDDFLPPP